MREARLRTGISAQHRFDLEPIAKDSTLDANAPEFRPKRRTLAARKLFKSIETEELENEKYL